MASPAARPSRLWPQNRVFYGWAVVGATFLASFGEVPAFGPILGLFIKPIEEELGWSRATLAMGFTIGSATGSLSAIVVGRLVDRYGPRVVVAFSGVLIALSLLGLSRIQEPWHFWLFFGLARGSAIAGIELGSAVAIAKWFVRKRGRALGVKGIGLRSGQAVLPMVVFAIMAASDWRTTYVALAGLSTLLIVVPSTLFLRRQPEDFGMQPDGDEAAHERGGRSAAAQEVSWTLADARRTRAFWAITLYLICTPFVQGATNLHMVPHFQDRGISDGLAFTAATLVGITSVVAIIPAGLILERVQIRQGAMIMAGFVLASMVVLLVTTSFWHTVVFAVIYGIAGGMRMIVETMLIASYFGREHLGAIKGFMAPFRIISPLGPVMAGFVFDWTGSYNAALIGFGCVAVFMVVMMVITTTPVRRAEVDAYSIP